MTREERIINIIKENKDGVNTQIIADILEISRENVSRILNKLVKKGKVIKELGKPVKYFYSENKSLGFEHFEKNNPSLKKAIDQAKSSVLYPPNGINTLIIGETGVGKSHFAQLMHQFAIETETILPEAPFTIFNCADYANNPELLMGTLFGIKKGAYTGAEVDKKGLIELSDNGILFLDEIHNLPQEGQEILFTFIDKGIYRRLGESELQRTARVRIIGATSESIVSTLIGPFRRRMPMIIEIPNLANRTEKERADLVQMFFENESKTLNKNIYISNNVFISLLYYECPHNIGQLKSDIQLLCAKAYSDFLIGTKSSIEIKSDDLPKQIAYGLWNKTEHRFLRTQSNFYSKSMLSFTPEESKDANSNTIYELLKNTVSELTNEQVASDQMKQIVEKEISNYFSRMDTKDADSKLIPLETIIEPKRMKTIEKIMNYVSSELKLDWDQNISMGFILHLQNLIERYNNQTLINNHFGEIDVDYQINYRKEFSIAMHCLQMISFEEKIQLPYSEANNIVAFFIHSYDIEKQVKQKKVQVVVIAHGDSTASSMANAVNNLLKIDTIIGVDAPLDMKPLEAMNKVVEKLIRINHGEDILCLVDMGSFLQINSLLENKLNVQVLSLPLVSTLYVLEAARKSLLGSTISSIYNDLLRVNFNFFGVTELKNKKTDSPETTISLKSNDKPFCILTCCLTGHGTAKYLKKILDRNFNESYPFVEIIALQLTDKASEKKQLSLIEQKYEILSIVSTFPVDYSCQQFNINDVMNSDGISRIEDIIQSASISLKIKQSLISELKNVDGGALFEDIVSVNEIIQKELAVRLNRHEIIGVIMHTAILIDNLKVNTKYSERNLKNIELYQNELLIIKNNFYPIEKKYDIKLTVQEYFPLLEYYLHLR